MKKNIKVLIVDDHPVVRRGLKSLLESIEWLDVVGEAFDGEDSIQKAASLNPDVILMDLVMPRKDGIQAIQAIKGMGNKASILVLTSFGEDDKVFPAIKAGASGYLLKDTTPEDLLHAIQEVTAGRPSLHPTVAAKLMQELHHSNDIPIEAETLTEREVQVLKLVARGFSNLEIAQELVISERTVCAHISNILNKLHLANRTQAALYALREGYTSLYEG